MTKVAELKEKSVEELEVMLKKLTEELFQMVNEKMANKKVEKPHRIKEMRKDKARILTVLTMKQKGKD